MPAPVPQQVMHIYVFKRMEVACVNTRAVDYEYSEMLIVCSSYNSNIPLESMMGFAMLYNFSHVYLICKYCPPVRIIVC